MTHERHGIYRYIGGWRFALDIFSEHPITGVGLNNLIYYEKYGLTSSHGLLGFIAQVGLVGTFAYVLFFGHFTKKLILLKSKMSYHPSDFRLASLGITLIIIPLIVSFGTGLYGFSSTFFWFEISLAILIYRNLEREYLKRNFLKKHDSYISRDNTYFIEIG